MECSEALLIVELAEEIAENYDSVIDTLFGRDIYGSCHLECKFSISTPSESF